MHWGLPFFPKGTVTISKVTFKAILTVKSLNAIEHFFIAKVYRTNGFLSGHLAAGFGYAFRLKRYSQR